MYRLDRMMQQLARSGKLAKCKAILVGHFSDMTGQKHFGITDPYDIVAQYVRPLGIPVVFGLPTGHEDPQCGALHGARSHRHGGRNGCRHRILTKEAGRSGTARLRPGSRAAGQPPRAKPPGCGGAAKAFRPRTAANQSRPSAARS